jgi:hypothetical protein
MFDEFEQKNAKGRDTAIEGRHQGDLRQKNYHPIFTNNSPWTRAELRK